MVHSVALTCNFDEQSINKVHRNITISKRARALLSPPPFNECISVCVCFRVFFLSLVLNLCLIMCAAPPIWLVFKLMCSRGTVLHHNFVCSSVWQCKMLHLHCTVRLIANCDILPKSLEILRFSENGKRIAWLCSIAPFEKVKTSNSTQSQKLLFPPVSKQFNEVQLIKGTFSSVFMYREKIWWIHFGNNLPQTSFSPQRQLWRNKCCILVERKWILNEGIHLKKEWLFISLHSVENLLAWERLD